MPYQALPDVVAFANVYEPLLIEEHVHPPSGRCVLFDPLSCKRVARFVVPRHAVTLLGVKHVYIQIPQARLLSNNYFDFGYLVIMAQVVAL
jgi:hypothetical protein